MPVPPAANAHHRDDDVVDDVLDPDLRELDRELEEYLGAATWTGRRRWRTMVDVLRNAALLVVLFLVVGNLVIALAWKVQSRGTETGPTVIADVRNFRVVDDRVWRGDAPSDDSFRDLAGHGVKTIVDLRAEENVHHDEKLLLRLGLELVHIPVRDGQAPTDAQVARFLDAVENSRGPVFVHCGAGVGRTGAMVGAYLVATGQASGVGAMRHALSVGPPSLEQLVFMATLDGGVRRPPAALVAVSRMLDGPRRLWSRFGV